MLASLKLWVFVNPQLHGACLVGTVSPCGACFQADLVSGPSCPSLTGIGFCLWETYGKHSSEERVAVWSQRTWILLFQAWDHKLTSPSLQFQINKTEIKVVPFS